MFLRKLLGLDNKLKLKIEVLDFDNAVKNKEIMSSLRKLTLCKDSGMNHELDELTIRSRVRSVKAKTILAKNEDKIVGWALLSRENSTFVFTLGKNYRPNVDGALFEIFVDPKFRRKGVGSSLLKTARKHAGPFSLCVAPHDNAGYSFYNKHKAYKQKRL